MASFAGRRRNCSICCWKIALDLRKFSSPAAAAIRTEAMRPHWSSCARAILPNTERGSRNEGNFIFTEAVVEDCCRAGDFGVDPVCLVLRWSGLYLRSGSGACQYGAGAAGRGGADYLLAAERTYPACTGVSGQPLRTALGSHLAVGKGTGF